MRGLVIAPTHSSGRSGTVPDRMPHAKPWPPQERPWRIGAEPSESDAAGDAHSALQP